MRCRLAIWVAGLILFGTGLGSQPVQGQGITTAAADGTVISGMTSTAAVPLSAGAAASSAEPARCRRLPPPPRRPLPPKAPDTQPSLVCGDVIVDVQAVGVAPSASAAPPPSIPTPPAPAASGARAENAAQIFTLGVGTAGALAILGLILLVCGLVAGSRNTISFDGNAGGFGGRAWGWRASPALVMLLGSAVALLLAVVVVAQMLQLASPAAVTVPATQSNQTKG